MPRHGRVAYSLTGINYRANIDAMKRAGVTDILSVSAVGSLKEEYAPGHFVLVDQFIDRTFAREKSFFGNGVSRMCRWRIPSATVFVRRLRRPARAWAAVHRWWRLHRDGGAAVFSQAESFLYRSWGRRIGMTNMPEAVGP